MRVGLIASRALLLALMISGGLSAAVAQVVPCSGSPVAQAYLDVSPPSPSSSQTIAISVGRVGYKPMTVAAAVLGNTIDVTLSADLEFLPTFTCGVTTIGPMSAGMYTVNFYLRELSSGTITLQRTTSLQVVGGPEAVPATSPLSLVFLATLVFLIAARRSLKKVQAGRADDVAQ